MLQPQRLGRRVGSLLKYQLVYAEQKPAKRNWHVCQLRDKLTEQQ